MKGFIQVGQNEFNKFVEWIEGANNYSGAAGRHEFCSYSHYVDLDSGRQLVAVHDMSEIEDCYLVREVVFQEWKKKFGYNITF